MVSTAQLEASLLLWLASNSHFHPFDFAFVLSVLGRDCSKVILSLVDGEDEFYGKFDRTLHTHPEISFPNSMRFN